MQDWSDRATREPYAALVEAPGALDPEVFSWCVQVAPHGAARGCFTRLDAAQRRRVITQAPCSVQRFALAALTPDEYAALLDALSEVGTGIDPRYTP